MSLRTHPPTQRTSAQTATRKVYSFPTYARDSDERFYSFDTSGHPALDNTQPARFRRTNRAHSNPTALACRFTTTAYAYVDDEYR